MMVSISGQEEQDWLFTQLLSVSTETQWWIGLNDRNNGGKADGSSGEEAIFVWYSGEAVEYTNWNSGEPNDYNGNEDCAGLYSSNGLWNDFICSQELFYICESQ